MAQQLAELTTEVHGPVVTHSSSSTNPPSYTRRRVNIPGPNLSFPYVITFGPKDITVNTAGQLVVQMPGGVRPMAIGWYSLANGGTTTFFVGKSATLASSNISPGMLHVSVVISTDTSGVVYYKNTDGANYIAGAAFTGGVDGVSRTDPEMPSTGATTPRPMLEAKIASVTGTLTEFSCWALVLPTRHCNTLSSSD